MRSLEEIRALCDAATPGPWEWNTWQYSIRCAVGWVGIVEHDRKSDGSFGDINADGELMAASRTLIPDLLDALAAKDTEIEQLRDRWAERDATIEELTAEVAAKDRQVDIWAEVAAMTLPGQ